MPVNETLRRLANSRHIALVRKDREIAELKDEVAKLREQLAMEETLFTAARRLVRYLNIDLNKGGIVTIETQQALHSLEVQIVKQQKRDEQSKFIEEERA